MCGFFFFFVERNLIWREGWYWIIEFNGILNQCIFNIPGNSDTLVLVLQQHVVNRATLPKMGAFLNWCFLVCERKRKPAHFIFYGHSCGTGNHSKIEKLSFSYGNYWLRRRWTCKSEYLFHSVCLVVTGQEGLVLGG